MTKIFGQSPKTRIKIHNFSVKNCPKNSSIHEECAFDKMTRTFWQKSRKFTQRIPTKRKKILPQNKFPNVFVWTLRMQFWQWNRKTFATKWKEIRTKSGAIYEILIFLKIIYPLIDPLDTYTAFLTTSPNCLNCFSERSTSNYLIITFRSRKFSTILFSVNIELIRDSNAENSMLKKWKISSLVTILKIDLLFVKVCSSGDSKYKINHQVGYFVPKVQKSLAQTPKKNRRGFFQKRYFA